MKAVEPDFDQIALELMDRTDDEAGQHRIAEQLRQVWNARGAADLEALAPVLGVNMDAEWDAIKKLDR